MTAADLSGRDLDVAVARALGWRELSLWPEYQGGRWHGTPPGPDELLPIYVVPPYGEDTPEGWECTGPLVSRFRLSVEERTFGVSVWDERRGYETACSHLDRCRGVAEWVAKHPTIRKVSERESAGGNHLACTYDFLAPSSNAIIAIFREIEKIPDIRVVL
jgi:hypothetical protein